MNGNNITLMQLIFCQIVTSLYSFFQVKNKKLITIVILLLQRPQGSTKRILNLKALLEISGGRRQKLRANTINNCAAVFRSLI